MRNRAISRVANVHTEEREYPVMVRYNGQLTWIQIKNKTTPPICY